MHLGGGSERRLSGMVHERVQETENAARVLKSCCSVGGPLPRLIALGASESLLMQSKLCSFFEGMIEGVDWKEECEGETAGWYEETYEFRWTDVRKQQSICRVWWSSKVTCQQAKNKME